MQEKDIFLLFDRIFQIFHKFSIKHIYLSLGFSLHFCITNKSLEYSNNLRKNNFMNFLWYRIRYQIVGKPYNFKALNGNFNGHPMYTLPNCWNIPIFVYKYETAAQKQKSLPPKQGIPMLTFQFFFFFFFFFRSWFFTFRHPQDAHFECEKGNFV